MSNKSFPFLYIVTPYKKWPRLCVQQVLSILIYSDSIHKIELDFLDTQ